MSWEFETEPDFQKQLDWVDEFVRTEVEPLDLVIEHPYDLEDELRRALIPPLQKEVKDRKLWATNLGPELGGSGFGQVNLALLNEILGRSKCGPIVFGCQAPDSGNAEILAHYGTDDLKRRYLDPLVAGEIVSCFSMTEPQGGSDPTRFVCRAELDGEEWVVNGEKWFSSHAHWASFFITMVVTEPDGAPYQRLSAVVIPADSPGIEIVRPVGVAGEPEGSGSHPYIRYDNVRIPADHLLGRRGEGFVVAQTRLGGGRIHHAMRTIGLARRAFDMMCERAVSRRGAGDELLSRKQMVQAMIADSWIQIEQFRLLVLRTAWRIDKYNDYKRVRADISAVKAAMPAVLHDVVARAIQIHGSLGISNEMPFGSWLLDSYHMGLADGATEVHKSTLARQVFGEVKPSEDLFPAYHLPRLRAEARQKYLDAASENAIGRQITAKEAN
jgi:acyl-CoA dehydrogenase